RAWLRCCRQSRQSAHPERPGSRSIHVPCITRAKTSENDLLMMYVLGRLIATAAGIDSTALANFCRVPPAAAPIDPLTAGVRPSAGGPFHAAQSPRDPPRSSLGPRAVG